LLVLLLVARPAKADESSRSVVVLRATPADAEPWPEGTQAVIAELLTAGYAVRVRSTNAKTVREVASELEQALAEARALAMVSVLRQSELGMALVHTRLQGSVRLEADAQQGTVAESGLALRVVELLREVDIPEPERRAPSSPPPPERRPVKPKPLDSRHRNQLWLGGGAAFASNVGRPFPWVTLSGAFTLVGPIAFEPTLGAAVISGQVHTEAGDLDLRAQQAALYLMFDPFVERPFDVALGLGGGGVLMQETARANTGYAAADDATRVGLVGVRVRGFLRTGRTSFVLAVEPGLLVPEVSVRGAEAVGIGRPWIVTTLGLGVSL